MFACGKHTIIVTGGFQIVSFIFLVKKKLDASAVGLGCAGRLVAWCALLGA